MTRPRLVTMAALVVASVLVPQAGHHGGPTIAMHRRALALAALPASHANPVPVASPEHLLQVLQDTGADRGRTNTGGTSPIRHSGHITVGYPLRHDVSPPLRAIKPLALITRHHPRASTERQSEAVVRNQETWSTQGRPARHVHPSDPLVQRSFQPVQLVEAMTPTTLVSWEGIDAGTGAWATPPDPNGDVGPHDYVQMVNQEFQIWAKDGTSLYGPAPIWSIWSGFGGNCDTQGPTGSDPIVLYDALADRWLMSDVLQSTNDTCIAVSQTGDPTGRWYRYDYQLTSIGRPDYPKFGIWPDGYYLGALPIAANCVDAIQPFVFDRRAMLAGQSAAYQTPGTTGCGGSILPADVDGPTLPPSGAAAYFVQDVGNVALYRFHVDWVTPANSTYTQVADLAVAPFTVGPARIPQPGTTAMLANPSAYYLMYRLAYRNFGDHESLVYNYSVDVGGGQAGIRWYEIRNPGTGPYIYQQGTYAPDAESRWIGSADLDSSGDLAIGYSVSSSSTYPSIRYAGRVPTDPLGTLPRGEITLQAGGGAQTGTSRWGDYSALKVDPTDGCTFWYTNEYYSSTSAESWQTRIGAFRFPGCTPIPRPTTTPLPTPPGTLPPTPTETPTPAPTSTPTSTATNTPSATSTSTSTPVPPRLVAGTARTSPFQRVVITGTNVGASEPVNVYWDSTRTAALTTTWASGSGAFSTILTVPQAISGTHTIIALGQHTDKYALTAITIQPELFVSPSLGTAGSGEVTVGFGFGASETVKEYWDKPLSQLGTTTSSTLGSFYGATAISATVPLSVTTGIHYVYGVGQTTHALGMGGFYVHT